MTRRKALVALTALVVTATVLLYGSVLARSRPNTAQGGFFERIGSPWFHRSGAGESLTVSGNIELTDVEVSFKIPGRIKRRYFDEGELVEPGSLIAELESDDLEKEVALREAEVRAAQAAWQEAQNGPRPQEIEAAKAAVEKARYLVQELQRYRQEEVDVAAAALQSAVAEEIRLRAEWERAKELFFGRGVLSEQDYDRHKSAHEVAAAKLREAQQRYNLFQKGPREEQRLQAEAALKQAEAQYEMLVKNTPRAEVKEQLMAKLEQAKAARDLAKTRLGYAKVFWQPAGPRPGREPGVVLSKNAEEGEYVAPGTPVLTIGDLARPWLRAYVDYDETRSVRYGQKARVYVGSDRSRYYEGRVGFIASEAEFTPKNVQTEKERTRLVYRIKIYVENRNLELKRGIPAEAEILLDSDPAAASGGGP